MNAQGGRFHARIRHVTVARGASRGGGAEIEEVNLERAVLASQIDGLDDRASRRRTGAFFAGRILGMDGGQENARESREYDHSSDQTSE